MLLRWMMFVVMLGFTGMIAWGIVVTAIARRMISPKRMSDGRAASLLGRVCPADLNMEYQDEAFFVDARPQPVATTPRHRAGAREAAIRLAAWWIPSQNPAGSDRCVVLLHGYADAKVGAIAWAPTWLSLGFNVLALDLRAHGESGGRFSTAGFFERYDLVSVLSQLRDRRPAQTRLIVLFGASLGAAVALAASSFDAANGGEPGMHAKKQVDAVVLEGLFPDFRSVMMNHLHLVRMPTRGFAGPSLWLARWMSGADIEAVKAVDLLKASATPALLIHAGNDVLVPAADQARLVAASGPNIEQWVVAGADHLMAMPTGPEEYRDRIARFLADRLTPASAMGGF